MSEIYPWRFSDRPDEERVAAITAVDAFSAGFDYEGRGITLTLARGKVSEALAWARRFDLRDTAWWHFPNADNLPDPYRHDGPYPGSLGFVLRVHFVPLEETSR